MEWYTTHIKTKREHVCGDNKVDWAVAPVMMNRQNKRRTLNARTDGTNTNAAKIAENKTGREVTYTSGIIVRFLLHLFKNWLTFQIGSHAHWDTKMPKVNWSRSQINGRPAEWTVNEFA